MGRFDNSELDKYADNGGNNVAPAGLYQADKAGGGFTAKDQRFANSALGKLYAEEGPVGTFQSWFTGANRTGEENGWNTEFMQKAIDFQDKALADGTANRMFEEKDATGVVTYDHDSSDGRTHYTFGDVYEDGKKVGNVYEQFEDKASADLMMTKLLFDGTQQARLFSENDPTAAIAKAVEGVRQENNANAAKALQAADFQEGVEAKAEDIAEGGSGTALVGGAAAGGAATGALVGSVVPGVGTLAGGLIGGGIGLVGGLLNKDELAEQAARASEITRISTEENGQLAGIATGIKEWGGFSTQLTSPLTQASHGLVELTGDNKVGDGKTGFYATDAKGDAQRPLWAKPLSLLAATGDAVAQFVSPLNRAIYATQMGGVIGGESAQLALTGEMFDPREGQFDNIFKDDDGNFDPVSGAAGIMKIGVDAVQVLPMLGLARQSRLAKEAIDEGGQVVDLAGHRFVLDQAGNVTKQSKTITWLAPSEQLTSWSAARSARVAAMKEGRVATADDFYRAATSMATGSNRLKQALVNGFGEGYEELVQGVLEPIALDGRLSVGDLADSFMYGAAAGAGMSLGATFVAPGSDARMKAQAYALETIRNGGVEPDAAQFDANWERYSDTEKRVLASRNKADAELTAQALSRHAEHLTSTLLTSDVDAAKAIDARRTAVEKELLRATTRTDAFTVMSGLLDAGRVDRDGRRLGDTLHPEAVSGSALTVFRLLENRLNGLGMQAQTLNDRALPEEQPLLQQVELARAVGQNILRDAGRLVAEIYDENTSEARARQLITSLNQLLEGFYAGNLPVAPPEGSTATVDELTTAAQHFTTLLASREPKLDTGSYLALLPHANTDLTLERADNLLQVNTDVLASINGDFDGDKLRAENQLILSPERFAQTRAGSNFAGAGDTVDIAARNFDPALAKAVGDALVAGGQLQAEAEATMDAIAQAVTNRYGQLMSPAALARVLDDFRTSVRAGSESARTGLLDSLGREAGEAIVNMGRENLRNEWLWASQVVRANFEAFQRSLWKLRALESGGPSQVQDVADIDTPLGTNARKQRAVTDAQTLSLFAVGNSLFRKFQKVHYTSYNAAVLSAAGTERADLYEMAALYEELARGVTRSEIARADAQDAIGARVLAMLARLVDDAMADPALRGQFSPSAAMSILANVKVKDVWYVDGEPVTDNRELSLVQLLLKRALEADREEHKLTFETDEKLQAKHARLRALTVPNDVAGDVNAERAFLEVFGAVPFADSLGGVTGALAPHTTPEQWLRNYISLDETGRRQMERLFENVPEYLDRKEHSNLPYSLAEAQRREVTPYRSMLDAMMAVGRSELTFDGKKLGGRRYDVARAAMEDFRDGHAMVLDAVRTFRKGENRRVAKKAPPVELVQQLFAANPVFGRQVLDLVPDAEANALFEYRDGELYVAPWIYEMFTIEDSKEALFFYWKNLTLTQWNATQVSGRTYGKLNSRFQRLMYQLAREPGQPHLELMLRKMDELKDLDAFFVWLNKTPGFRGQQAPLVPFNDDVADFEADAGGGWVTSRASLDLRQAITAMRKGAEQLRETMDFREERAATDRRILDGIKRAHAGDPAATMEDRENLRKLRKAIATSQQLPRGFAPSAMLALTQGSLRGFDAHSTDKGISPDSYQPLGEFQALMDAFGFVPEIERVMELLTAHSISSLETNVGDLAKTGGVAMDSHGREIQWSEMSVDEAIAMLDDSRTAPLAYALLTPKALDLANGKLSERLLMDASLKELLDNGHYTELFDLDGDGAMNKAMRYLSILDSRARAEGGHFEVIRYVNSLAAARTSGLGREATETDLARLRDQAYLDTARMLQMVGSVLANPDTADAGVLAELRKLGVKTLREQNQSRRLPGLTDEQTGLVVEPWVDRLVNDLETERLARHEEARRNYSGADLNRQIEAIDRMYDRNVERIRGVLEDDILGAIVERFRITGDPALDQAARAQIVEFARAQSSFPARAPEAAGLWSELVDGLLDGRTPGDDFDWETLSRSVMGVYLADEVLRVGSHVTIPPFPKGDPATSDSRFYKYFDPSYTWIATDLLTEGTPLAVAAEWLHTQGEQPRVTKPIEQLRTTMRRTVLNDKNLGAWTPGLMSQIVESQQRMDSAAAGQGIAQPGNGPKRWAAVGAATRANANRVPDVSLLSTVAFPADLLAEDVSIFTEIPVTHATGAGTMPVAQLDNRFVRQLRVNGVEVPLTAENLGFQYHGEETDTGYRYVALPRLRRVLQRMAETQGVPLAALQVEIDFFHPDSRPAGPEWMNNVYFDGRSHSLLPDGSESLVAAFWSDNGGMIGRITQQALDAGKTGTPAIKPFIRPDSSAIVNADSLFPDLAALLRSKTEILLERGVDPSYYNAVYKMFSLHHLVVLADQQVLTAEDYIARRAAGETLEVVKLLKLSPDVLRSMVGETGDQGVERFFDEEYLLNPDLIGDYTGVTDAMLEKFGDGWFSETGSLVDTRLVNVGLQRTLRVRTQLTEAERNARQERIQFLNDRADEIRTARYAKIDKAEARQGYLATLQLAIGAINVERNTFNFMGAGIPIAPREVIQAEHTARLVGALGNVATRDSFERGWQVVDAGAPDTPGGLLTVESLDVDRPAQHQIALGDVVLLRLDTFERPERDVTQVEDRVERALRSLVNTGASIVLGSGNGRGDLRDFAYRWLREHGYSPVAGSRHLLGPTEYVQQSQNERAYQSTLTETRRVQPYRNIVTFLSADPIGADENDAALNPASVKLRDRKLVSNILPTASYPNYNLLLDTGSPLYEKALAHLRGITDPANAEARATLVAMAGADPAARMPIEDALDRFHAKITNTSSLLPEPGDQVEVGDIFPFVHPDGHVILYRHGFKPPKPEVLRDREREGGLSVTLAKSETDPNITANTGTVVAVAPRAGFGRTLAIEVPLQPLGDKIQLEWNGMKYVVVPPSSTIAGAMSVPLFGNGTVVDLFSDLASANSKEAYEGRTNHLRNALALYQFDFTDDLVEFFFPGGAKDPAARTLVVSMLDKLSRDTSLEIPTADADILAKANVAVADMLASFAAAQDQRIPSDWTTRLTTDSSPQALIAQAVVTYLLTPGAELENVLKSAGFSHRNAGNDTVYTRLVPGLFADLLDHGPESALHAELIRRFDAQLSGQPGGAGWRLHPDWSVSVYDAQGHELRGYLQFGEAHSSGDNPMLDGQAFDPNEDAGVSAHNAMAAFLSLGATTAHKALEKSKAFAKSFTKGGGVTKFGDGESLWKMLTALPDEKDSSLAGWRRETPAETLRRSAARDELVGFYQPLDTEAWTDEQRAEYESTAASVLGHLNLYGAQRAMVDTWVRDHLGRPQGQDSSGVERGNISGSDAVEAAKEILRNVRDGQLPHAGANLPLIDVNHLTTLYLANFNREDGKQWAPIDTATGTPATTWDQWVEHAFGTAFKPEAEFDQVYLLAADGRMHGYQGATTATRYLPVSSDLLRQNQLMDPETNRMVVSIAADENTIATDPTLFATTTAQLEEIIGGQRIYSDGRDGADPRSAKGRQKARLERWRKEVDAPRQAGKRMRGVRGPGQTFLGHTTKTSAFWRSMINLRAGNALFNVALVVSAPVEAFYRRTINSVANAAVGESTGSLGRLAAKVGVTQRYSPEQINQLNLLVDALSSRADFKALVYKELMYQYPSMPGIGRVEKWLERYAKFGARIQDPAWGMLPKDLARIYVETVMRKLAADPLGENIYSADRLLIELARNPEWIQQNDLEAHNMAIAAISNVRSIKPNVISLFTRGIVEPMSENPKFVVNSAGNLLKMMTLFQNFWSNSVINMTGLQGPADFAAFWLDGRKKSKLTRRMQAAIAGETFVPDETEAYDMSEVIEGLDLADSFIRGGITHTALFTLGMMANGLGLSGEDDEEKWRRRQAELQGVGLIRDPRKLVNDFRNKGAIYLNWLPLGLDSLFTSEENPEGMFQMNWVMRYFASPIIGFERFYQTGDFSEVIHGFGDALGSHPVVNTQLWNEALDTAAELHSASNDAIEKGDEQQGAHLLITAVGVLERMVMENSMVNMIYVGADRYDRDPYVLPRIDSDGNQQLDVRGNPYENPTLKDFVNDQGEVQQGYVTRDEAGATLRTFTENRFGLALVTSLWNGLTGREGGVTGSDTLRQNMAIKVRSFELMPTERSDVERLFEGAYALEGGQASLTEGEAAQIIKRAFEARGEYWDADEVEKMAKTIAARSGVGGMSIVDGAGKEVLTPAGARAVFEGLRKEAVKLSDSSLAGIYIDGPTRDKIRDEMAADLVQEGVNLGMSKDQATWRMRRIMFGTNAPAGSVKLIDLIYTDQIPFNDTLEYNQLNTTYVLDANGMPMATGFTRDGLAGALGVKPLLRPLESKDTGLASDSVLNTVDNVAGVNLGMRGLEARPESWEIPTIEDITKKGLDDILKAIEKLDFSPSQPYQNKRGTGYGYGGYRRYGRGGGYGGGGGSYGYPNFTRMYTPAQIGVPYGNNIPFINTTNPIIRRADVRRERVWSERGRLKQWQ